MVRARGSLHAVDTAELTADDIARAARPLVPHGWKLR